MVSTSKVVEDGVETPRRRKDRSHWGWLGAGLMVGAGITFLLNTSQPEIAPAPTTFTSGTTTVSPATPGIGTAVGGFPDGLVGVKRSDGRSLDLVVWPLAGDIYERSVTVGTASPPSPVGFDLPGRMLATLVPAPGGEGSVLYAGVPDSAPIIAVGVTGYAWHDSAGAALAYTTDESGETLLWVTRGNLAESELVARAVGIEGGVVAWGQWGFALQDGDSVVLLTDTGEIKDTHPGRVLASYATGWLAIEGDEVALLSAGGGVRGLDREGLGDGYLGGKFSGNGEYLALLSRDGLSLVDLEEETGVVESGSPPGVPQLLWSTDNRFVVYPAGGGRGFKGVIVVDTEDYSVDQVLPTETFVGLGILPGMGS